MRLCEDEGKIKKHKYSVVIVDYLAGRKKVFDGEDLSRTKWQEKDSAL